MVAISTRQPEVWVSYTDKKTGERKVKHFANARNGRSFFTSKFNAGNNPSVHRSNPMYDTNTNETEIHTDTNTATETPTVTTTETPTPTAKKTVVVKKSIKRSVKKKAPAKTPVKKKKAPTKKKTPAKKTTPPVTSGKRGRTINPDKLGNMLTVLRTLVKLAAKNPDGFTKEELREKLKFQNLGTPNLEAKGLIVSKKIEGRKGWVYSASEKGKDFVAGKGTLEALAAL